MRRVPPQLRLSRGGGSWHRPNPDPSGVTPPPAPPPAPAEREQTIVVLGTLDPTDPLVIRTIASSIAEQFKPRPSAADGAGEGQPDQTPEV